MKSFTWSLFRGLRTVKWSRRRRLVRYFSLKGDWTRMAKFFQFESSPKANLPNARWISSKDRWFGALTHSRYNVFRSRSLAFCFRELSVSLGSFENKRRVKFLTRFELGSVVMKEACERVCDCLDFCAVRDDCMYLFASIIWCLVLGERCGWMCSLLLNDVTFSLRVYCLGLVSIASCFGLIVVRVLEVN